MLRGKLQVLVLAPILAMISSPALAADTAPLQTVPSVDLKRYVGDWYEIARYPNRFEKQCADNVKVNYQEAEDGKILVTNACRKEDGKADVAHGKAKVVNAPANSKLKVTFFWPLYGDYWIIDLDPEYRFAVVGEPDRKYLWILSRTPEMSAGTYDEILKRIAAHGYDVSKLVKTPQKETQAGPAASK